jgi:hypothetical protein
MGKRQQKSIAMPVFDNARKVAVVDLSRWRRKTRVCSNADETQRTASRSGLLHPLGSLHLLRDRRDVDHRRPVVLLCGCLPTARLVPRLRNHCPHQVDPPSERDVGCRACGCAKQGSCQGQHKLSGKLSGSWQLTTQGVREVVRDNT